ncbi:serine hydrolase domain-containing protein [Longibacter sp.]|uniref:serine hydrolase domain-containing protein n=1 Tax=Longibacter sp. TaxID=2045415 RepID=UPI003EC132C3
MSVSTRVISSLLIAGLLFVLHPSRAQTFGETGSDRTDAPTSASAVERIVEAHMSAKPIPGLSVAVAQNGRMVHQSASGITNLVSMQPASNHSIYQLASVTKIITGIGLMILVDEGRLALDDSIHQHLPSLPQAWSGVTVRQVVSHTSGLPPLLDENGNFPGGSRATAWERAKKDSLIEEPGTVWRYSQMGGEVIRRVAEEITDQSWERFVHERILEPANMQSTYFLHEAPPDSSRVTTGYDLENGSLIAHEWSTSYDYYIPTAMGIFSTTTDLARLMTELRTERLLSPSAQRAMWTPVRHEEGGMAGWGDGTVGYGIGWVVDSDHERPRKWHSGGGHSTLVYYPQVDLTVIVLTNLSGAQPNAIASEIAAQFL